MRRLWILRTIQHSTVVAVPIGRMMSDHRDQHLQLRLMEVDHPGTRAILR